MGEMLQIIAHHSTLSPAWVANRAVARHLRSQLAVSQNEMRQDGEDGFTHGTLHAPDGETARVQADPDIMGVARQAPAAPGRLVCELEADRQDKGEDALDKRFGVAQELRVGRLIVEIDGEYVGFRP